MPNQDDPQLRGLLKGVLRAEQAEAQEGTDAPDPESDRRLARLMAERHGRPVRTPRRLWLGAGAALSSVALVALLLFLRPWEGAQAAPQYRLAMRSDENVMSTGASPGEAKRQIRIDSTLEINLVPQRTENTPVHIKAFTQRGGVYSEWPVPLAHKPGGAIQVQGVVRDLPGLPVGQVELVFVLGRDALPASGQLVQNLSTPERDAGSNYQVLRASLEILEKKER